MSEESPSNQLTTSSWKRDHTVEGGRNSVTTFDIPSLLNNTTDFDPERMKLLFDLQERERDFQFKRQMEVQRVEHEFSLARAAKEADALKLQQELSVSKMEVLYKMMVSVGALVIGTVLVLKGHAEVGFFLVGGGMTSVTSDVVGLMRGARKS